MQPGARLGEWIVIRELGRGAMGVVFEARHAERGDRAAVKVLAGFIDEVAWRRFAREAEAGAVVPHRNILRVLGAGREGGRPYIAMELALGGSLEQRVKRAGRLPWREVAAIGAALGHALHALHGGGFVHRDVKPANVLFDESGTPKLADFGLVRPVEDGTALTASNLVVGTPAFLSPEQANAKPVTPASDVYGLGCTLHAALTGAPPFKGQTFDVLRRHLQDAPPDVRSLVPDVPEAFAALLLRCLSKDATQRDSAASLARALEGLLDREEAGAAPEGAARSRPRRGRPALVAAVVAAALSAILVVVWATRPPRDGGGPGPEPPAPTPPPPPRVKSVIDVLPVSTRTRPDLGGVSLVTTLVQPREGAPPKQKPLGPPLRLRAAWGTTRWLHGGQIEAAVFLERTPFFATGGTPEHNVRIWDASGQQIVTWGARGKVSCMALASSGSDVIVGNVMGDVVVGSARDAQTHWAAARDPNCRVLDVGPSFQGNGVAVWADGLVRTFALEPPPGEKKGRPEPIDTNPARVQAYKAAAIARSDTRTILIDAAGRAYVRQLDLPDVTRTLALPAPVDGVAISDNGRLAVLHTRDALYYLDPLDPKAAVRTIRADAPVKSVFVGPAGRFGYVATDGVRLFEDPDRPPTVIDVPQQENERAFAAEDGRLLVGSATGAFRLWVRGRGITGEENPIGRIHGLAVSPDGERLATCSEEGIVTAWSGGDRPWRRFLLPRQLIRTIAFSPDGRLVVARGDLFAKTLSLEDDWSELDERPLRSISVVDRTKRLAVGTDGAAHLRTKTGETVIATDVFCGELSADGRRAALVRSTSVDFWEVEPTPHLVESHPLVPTPRPFHTALFDPTWATVATFVRDDGTAAAKEERNPVQLWRAATGALVSTTPTRHIFGVTSASFSQTGELLATTGYDRRVVVYRTRDGAPIAEQPTGPLINDHAGGVAFTADGQRLYAGSSRGQLLLYDLPR